MTEEIVRFFDMTPAASRAGRRDTATVALPTALRHTFPVRR